MFSKRLLYLAFIVFTSAEAVPSRLNPQCRSNVCDDRPQCPKTSCRCLFASRLDCTIYYQCVNGKPVQYRCSPGLLFNNETLSCDYSYNVHCNASTAVPVSTQTTNAASISYATATKTPGIPTQTNMTEDEFTSTDKMTEYTTSTITPVNVKTDETNEESSSPSEETEAPIMSTTSLTSTAAEITQEHITVSVSLGTETESTVSETTLNISTISADSESVSTKLTSENFSEGITSEGLTESTSVKTSVDHMTSKITDIPTSIASETPSTKTGGEDTAFTSTLSEIITTTESSSTKHDLVVTNSTLGTTEGKVISSTKSPPSDFLCPTRFGLYADPKNCNWFFQCSHWKPYHIQCPSDLHFNPKLEVCDWPYRAGCAYPTTDPMADDVHLACDTCESCFIPDKSDCASYIYCQNGKGYRLRCTDSLLFNPKKETCDLASNVKCLNQTYLQCPKPDGLFPAKDCSKFIHCSNGIAYLKDCPDGLHFNAEILVCDWPENVKCDEVPIEPTLPPTDNENANRSCNCDCCFLPHDKDCSKYILCLDGYMHVGRCSSGLLFNPSIQNCDLAERVICGEKSPLCLQPNGLFPNPDQCSSYIKCSNGSANVQYCSNGMHFSVNKRQCLDPCKARCDNTYNCNTTSSSSSTTASLSTTQSSLCPEEDGLFPNVRNCSLFYQCSGGRAYTVACPAGLHFSIKFKVCDYPCEAKCNSSVNCGPSSSSSTTPVIASTSVLSPVCPERNGLYLNENDCTTFYQCSEGEAYLVKCPPGLHFSNKHKVCDYPCDANCNSSMDCSPATLKPTSSSGSLNCPAPDGLYPATGECSAFYLCSNGKDYLIPCPPGLHFSVKHETCEEPCTALCNTSLSCGTTMEPTSTTHHPMSPECGQPDGTFSNPNDCGSFYQCSGGRSVLINCPSGLHFSMEDSACEKPCVAGCDLNIECPPELPNTKGNCTCEGCYFPDLTDCSAFYYCDEGELLKSYCPFGTLFNKTSSVCEEENVVDCEANGDPGMCPEPYGFFPYPGDCKKFVHCDNSIAHIKECQEDLEYDPQHRVCTKPKGYCGEIVWDPNCLEPTGMFPDPKNCSLFYHCEHGVAYPKLCSSPLMFNSEKKVCDWPNHVNCSKENIGTTTLPTATTKLAINITTTRSSSSSTTTTPSTSECYEVPGVICPCACRVPTYDECSSYFKCQEDGTACKKFCPEGLYFNKREMMCDLPENVECRDFFFSSIRRAKLFSHRLTS